MTWANIKYLAWLKIARKDVLHEVTDCSLAAKNKPC